MVEIKSILLLRLRPWLTLYPSVFQAFLSLCSFEVKKTNTLRGEKKSVECARNPSVPKSERCASAARPSGTER